MKTVFSKQFETAEILDEAKATQMIEARVAKFPDKAEEIKQYITAHVGSKILFYVTRELNTTSILRCFSDELDYLDTKFEFVEMIGNKPVLKEKNEISTVS